MARIRQRGEQGATLIFVIAFMVLAGFVAAAMSTRITSNLNSRIGLDTARNREYAADGAVEADIAQVRSNMQNGAAIPAAAPGTNSAVDTQPCPTTELTQTLNGVTIQVACTPAFSLTQSGFGLELQRNAIFTACVPPGAGKSCTSAGVPTMIDAQVNFVSTDPISRTSITVTKTNVESWSVNP